MGRCGRGVEWWEAVLTRASLRERIAYETYRQVRNTPASGWALEWFHRAVKLHVYVARHYVGAKARGGVRHV